MRKLRNGRRLLPFLLSYAVAVVGAAASGNTLAVEMELINDTLYISKTSIEDGDGTKYFELTRGKSFTDVVLIDQPGGRIDEAKIIANDFTERKVRTTIVGACQSACTILFLGGVDRRFSSATPIATQNISVHSSYDVISGSQTTNGWSILYNYYQMRLGDSFDADVIGEAIVKSARKSSFLRIYHPDHKSDALFCKWSTGSSCKVIVGKDALTLGFITTKELNSVEVPDYLIPKVALIAGLPPASNDRPISPETFCSGKADSCPTLIKKFLEASETKALAVSTNGFIGIASGYTNPKWAAWQALYDCVKQSERTCSLEYLAGREVRGLRETHELESQQALAELKLVDLKNFDPDPSGEWELPMTDIRTSGFESITPERIEGVTEISTADLIKMLKADVKPS